MVVRLLPAVDDDLADNAIALDKLMGFAQRVWGDRCERLRGGWLDAPLVDEVGHLIQQPVLFTHVRGVLDGAGEHQLPVPSDALILERKHIPRAVIDRHGGRRRAQPRGSAPRRHARHRRPSRSR